jgi:hypothetical protein
MRRPRGVTGLSGFLTFLGILALLGLAVIPWRPLGIAPQLLPLGEVTTRWLLVGTLVLYCATSLACASALRRLRPNALLFYYAFVISVALYCSVFLFLIRVDKPLGIGIIFFALLGAAVYWGWRIARRASHASSDAL